MQWSGAIVDVPDGWALCDGTNSTPDLRDKFVIGAGLTFAVDGEKGTVNHAHTFTGTGHNHYHFIGGNMTQPGVVETFTDSVAVTGTTDNAATNPPYYSLAFIMATR